MSPVLLADGREYSITTDVWDVWKERARTFESPEDVLRREFGLREQPAPDASVSASPKPTGRLPRGAAGPSASRSHTKEESSPDRSRAPSHLLLPAGDYELPILRALEDAGGRRATREALHAVGNILESRFKEADKETLTSSGVVRWQNRAQFARLHLVREGLLKKDSPRGMWELTDAGRRRLEEEGQTA
jgi:hypothetical protein